MAEFNFGTRVIFENGARARLQQELRSVSINRPLIATDEGLFRAGIVAEVLAGLGNEISPIVFDAVLENPTEFAVEQAANLFADQGCNGIVGLGGGSPMDLAKALAVRVGDGQSLARRAFHVCGWNPPGLPSVPPLILMPTTSGTGSEVSRGAVLTFKDGRKSGILCIGIVRLALCDPELTYDLPAHLTAATGMDAISHCVEAFSSPTVNPLADAIALDGLQRLVASIETATLGRSAAARWDMMLGSLEGGMVLQKGIGAIHALSHPLGASGIHHGLLNAVLLPHVLSWNATALTDKLPRLRQAVGLQPDAELAPFFYGLRERLGLPGKLRDLGLDRSALPTYAEQSVADSSQSNPLPMRAEDYLSILSAAW